jgi:hypothetical protein
MACYTVRGREIGSAKDNARIRRRGLKLKLDWSTAVQTNALNGNRSAQGALAQHS